MHAEIINGEWQISSPHTFRAARPNMLIPDAALEGLGLIPVQHDPMPEVAWNEAADGALIERDGRPVWAWTVRPKTAEELDALRAGMELSRAEFILRAVAAGLISEEDGEAASRGELPPGLAALVTPSFADRVRWGASTRVLRNDPLIRDFALAMDVSDEQLDALFMALA